MTCGLQEQNLRNNVATAQALSRHGWDVRLVLYPGGHDWDEWRRAARRGVATSATASGRVEGAPWTDA